MFFLKTLVIGIIIVSLSIGMLIALTLPAWFLVIVQTVMLIVLGFALICRK